MPSPGTRRKNTFGAPPFFRTDRQTSGLAFTGHYTPVGNPSIIVFLDLARTER
jgi:hypothetical protein